MDTLPARAPEHNKLRGTRPGEATEVSQSYPASSNAPIIPLLRPRIERERDGPGWLVIRGSHGWLFGDRKQAIAELDELAAAEHGSRIARQAKGWLT